MKEINVYFYGVDSWNRPIFKDTEDNRYFGDTMHLFGYAEYEKIDKFYKDKDLNKYLTYFGRKFDCEPLGISPEELNITLKEYKYEK